MARHNIEPNDAYTFFKNYDAHACLLLQLYAAFAKIVASLKEAWDNNNKLYNCIDTLEKQLNLNSLKNYLQLLKFVLC